MSAGWPDRRSVRLGCVALACSLAAACDARVTTIGAWSPARTEPRDAGAARPPDATVSAQAGRDAALGEDGGRLDAGIPDASGIYLEAEDGELSGGFTIDRSDPRASGGAALLAPDDTTADADNAPGPARARFAFALPAAGTYAIWGRVRALGVDDNRFWFQLDGGEWIKWRISTGEIWYWDDFHRDREYGRRLPFALTPGAHELVIASCVPGARLDRLYVTGGGDEPPGNETPCRPPHSIEVAGECLPSCGILQGTRCGVVACEGHERLPAYDCDVCCRVEP